MATPSRTTPFAASLAPSCRRLRRGRDLSHAARGRRDLPAARQARLHRRSRADSRLPPPGVVLPRPADPGQHADPSDLDGSLAAVGMRVPRRLANRLRRTLLGGAEVLPSGRRAMFAGFVLGDDRDQRPEVTDDFAPPGSPTCSWSPVEPRASWWERRASHGQTSGSLTRGARQGPHLRPRRRTTPSPPSCPPGLGVDRGRAPGRWRCHPPKPSPPLAASVSSGSV